MFFLRVVIFVRLQKKRHCLKYFLLNGQHALDGNPKAVDSIAQKQHASKAAPSTTQINTTWWSKQHHILYSFGEKWKEYT